MKINRIVIVLSLMAASVCAAQDVKTPVNENREEQAHMANEKVIMLIEAKIQPQRRAELVEATRQYLPLVRAEAGVEAFYVTVRKDDPNTFVFTRFTSRRQRKISICSRTLRRSSWRHSRARRSEIECGQISPS